MTKRGLFIGLTTVDIQYFVDQQPIPNTKIKTEEPIISAGGPAANAAASFAFLGGEADFLTCIGHHSFNKFIYNDFSESNINLIDIQLDKTINPIISVIITNCSNSERTIFTHHPGALKSIDEQLVMPALHPYEFIFIDGFYPEIAFPICRKAKEEGIKVIFDGGSWKSHLPEIIPFIDIAICSNNFQPPDCSEHSKIFDFFHQAGVKWVAISRGEENILTPELEINVEKTDAIDSLGAGDVLHGAFCWYYSQKHSFYESLRKAAQVASFSTRFKGTRSWMKEWSRVQDNILS